MIQAVGLVLQSVAIASFSISFADAAFLVFLRAPSPVAKAHRTGPSGYCKTFSVVLSEQSRRFCSAFKVTLFPQTSTAFDCVMLEKVGNFILGSRPKKFSVAILLP